MSEQKHTNGSWRLVDLGEYSVQCDADAYDMIGVGLNDGYPLAIVVSRNPIFSKAEANARLIAAAPDMLEALKALLERYHIMGCGDGPEALQARAAISKALTPIESTTER